MSQNNIVFATASELAESIKSRKLSSYEVTLAFYNQIEKYNKTYNAVITLDKDAALKRAREADLAISKGENWGKLHGVPITIKDNYKTKGILTTSGYLPLKNNIPTENAEIVKLKNGQISYNSSQANNGNQVYKKDHYGNIDFWGSKDAAYWDGHSENNLNFMGSELL